MMKKSWKFIFTVAAVIGLIMQMAGFVRAESYTSSTMRLLHYDGDVEILDADGKPRFIMENARFDSGEAMQTGDASSASVGMDESKIVTLDENTRVEFVKKSKAMQLNLKEGRLLLDVQEKLDENATLDIQTATMVVGIRGTIVYASQMEEESAQSAGTAGENSAQVTQPGVLEGSTQITQLGVLEGRAQLTYRDESGSRRQMSVEAGQKATLSDSNRDGVLERAPVIEPVTAQDLEGFVNSQLETDETLRRRVEKASNSRKDPGEAADDKTTVPALKTAGTENYPADGTWTWEESVTLVAQSASKIYDGQPLTRPSDVLVYGLPAQFQIQVNAAGSQTDVGTGQNAIENYVIYNADGENVTSHFMNINKVSGNLVVDPAPLYVWTGSAQKVYDGRPLTSGEASLHSTSGYQEDQEPWRNSSYVITGTMGSGSYNDSQDFYDSETLYGICGTVWVHGSNPLTGEVREMRLFAGQKMTVYLHEDVNGESIEFLIETVAEDKIPKEILRVYADNPDLLAQACSDTGWNPNVIAERIAALSDDNGEGEDGVTREAGRLIEKEGLHLREEASDRLMTESTNVRIHVDTSITSYNGRSLNSDEAHYTPVRVDSGIRIITTGSRTEVGESVNTYTIDWGNANPDNYILSEELGTLRVTQAAAVVHTSSAVKVYDGTPLTNSEASVTGLVNGERATVTATGSQTEAGTSRNTYVINWETANSGNYAVTEDLGTLTVTAAEDPRQDASVTFTAASAKKTYDGTPLTNAEVTADGLPDGYTFVAETTGSQTDAGSSENAVSSYQILDADGKDVTNTFTNIRTVNGTLTVEPAQATVITRSAAREYDGTELSGAATIVETSRAAAKKRKGTSGTGLTASKNGVRSDDGSAAITGLTEADAKEVTIVATGTITKLGTIENSYRIDWGSANEDNYALTEKLGTLKIKKNTDPITILAGSAERVYDGTALTEKTAKVQGLPSALTYTAQTDGSQTDAGSSDNTISSYQILDADGEDVTDAFANITIKSGTLTVRPAPAEITTGSAVKEYDGTPLSGETNASAAASITGLTDADAKAVTVTATGAVTNVGTADNTYEIDWGSAKKSNYVLTEKTGTLEVTKNTTAVTLTAGSASKVFDGTALTEGTVTAQGLPSALTTAAQTSGSITDAGSVDNTISSYRILDAEGNDVTAYFADIHTENGTLSVAPLQLNVDMGGKRFVYDGTPHFASPAGTYGNGEHAGGVMRVIASDPCNDEMPGEILFELISGDTLRLEFFGSVYDAGVDDIWEEHVFTKGNESNYIVSCTNSTFTVDRATLTIKTGSAEKVYDGTPLTCNEVTVTGLVSSDTDWGDGDVKVWATGSRTEVGESKNTYDISWGWIDNENYTVVEELGTLKVKSTVILGEESSSEAGLSSGADSGTDSGAESHTSAASKDSVTQEAEMASETASASEETVPLEDESVKVPAEEGTTEAEQETKEAEAAAAAQETKEAEAAAAAQEAKETEEAEAAAAAQEAEAAETAQETKEVEAAAAAQKAKEAEAAAAAQKAKEAEEAAAAQKAKEAEEAAAAQKAKEAEEAAAAQKAKEAEAAAAAQKAKEAEEAAAAQKAKEAEEAAAAQKAKEAEAAAAAQKAKEAEEAAAAQKAKEAEAAAAAQKAKEAEEAAAAQKAKEAEAAAAAQKAKEAEAAAAAQKAKEAEAAAAAQKAKEAEAAAAAQKEKTTEAAAAEEEP